MQDGLRLQRDRRRARVCAAARSLLRAHSPAARGLAGDMTAARKGRGELTPGLHGRDVRLVAGRYSAQLDWDDLAAGDRYMARLDSYVRNSDGQGWDELKAANLNRGGIDLDDLDFARRAERSTKVAAQPAA